MPTGVWMIVGLSMVDRMVQETVNSLVVVAIVVCMPS